MYLILKGDISLDEKQSKLKNILNKNEDFEEKDTKNTNALVQNFTNNKNVTVVDSIIVNTFNHASEKDKTRKPLRENKLIFLIENELKNINNTIEKLTLWVLGVELSVLDGLTDTELQKLHDFLKHNR